MLGISFAVQSLSVSVLSEGSGGGGGNYGELLDDNLCPMPQKGWTWIRQWHRAARKALRQQFS